MGAPSRTPEFVRAFRELFDGRRDIHGEPLGSARGGYVKEDVTDDLVREHLEGRRRIGIYNVVGSRVRWVCVDLDIPTDIAHGWTLAVMVARRLTHYGLAPVIERTRTKGWHVWLFFQGWIEAWKVRRVVDDVVVKIDLREHLTVPPLQTPAEVFPKQDLVPPGGSGNYVNLPLHGVDAQEGRTCFYEPAADGSPKLIEEWNPANVVYSSESAVDELVELAGLAEPRKLAPRIAPILPSKPGDAGTNGHAPERRITQLWPCGITMLKDGIGEGSRNECCFRLAVQCKHLGMPLDRALEFLSRWNGRNAPPLSDKEFKTTVSSAYDPKHHAESYGCENPSIAKFCVKTDCAIYRKDHPEEALAAGWKPNEENKKNASETGQASEPVEDDPSKGLFESMDLRTMTFVYVRPIVGMRYTVIGLDNRGKGASLRTPFLRVEHAGKSCFTGNFNLGSQTSRRNLGREILDKQGVADIDVDIMDICDGIMRRLQDEAAKIDLKEETARQGYALSAKEDADARAWAAAHPRVIYDAIEFTSRTGMVKEKKNRGLLLLLLTSRKMDSPISGIGKGDSSSGKSFLAASMLKLIPDEDVKEYTRVSAQALFYGGEFSLQHKILYIREAPGSEESEHSIRTFQSEGDLHLYTVQKDEATGRNKAEDIKIKGPICFYTTTTSIEVNPENETRLLTIASDETEQATRAFFDPRAYQAQFGSIAPTEEELKRWKNFQRVLDKGLLVIVPYALRLTQGFPTQNVRARRDFGKMMELIKASAFLHQHHRRKDQIVDDKGQPRDVVYASVADYEIVKSLVEESVMRVTLGIKPGQEAMLAAVDGLTETALMNHERGEPLVQMAIDGVDVDRHVWIESSLLRAQLGKTQRSVNKLIHSLEDDGLLVTAKEKKPLRVRLAQRRTRGDAGGLRLDTIPPEELYAEYPHDRKDSYRPTDAPDFQDIYNPDGKRWLDPNEVARARHAAESTPRSDDAPIT